jgi:outer membrane protein OmpA-like peptidoglycan-associated protein
MKKILTLILFAIISTTAYSQIYQEVRYGIGAGTAIAINEVKDRQLNLSLKASVRYPFSEMFFADLNVGYLNNSGMTYYEKEYKTSLIPIDLRLNFAPIIINDWLPYAFVGIGGDMFSVVDASPAAASDAKESGFAPFATLGAGIERKINDNFSLDLNISGNPHFTDDLNGEHDNRNDGFWNFTLSLFWTPGSDKRDEDGDGLSEEFELQLGTDPKNADTDGDGLNDGVEFNKYKTNPKNADSDGDGLKDGVEVNDTNTDPNVKDTDNDGLTDGDEVLKYKTDPLKADTDGDTLKDGEEVSNYKTNPLKTDTDNDGLTDGDEIFKYKTRPLEADTDLDKLSDGDEVLKHKTDPLKADTDGDGLNDFDEIMVHRTNPLEKDTDKGSVEDGVEVNRGTNPLDKSDDVAAKATDDFLSKKDAKIELEGVFFDTGKSDILPTSETVLNRVFKTLKDNPQVNVEISGHTDNVGNKKKNQKLSEERANSVRTWLINKGISESRMTAKGYGDAQPKVANDTPENKAKNRRIEMTRTDK